MTLAEALTKAAGAIDVRLAERRRGLELTLFGDGLSPEDIAAVMHRQRVVDAAGAGKVIKKTTAALAGA